jgi:hypothetical protein
MTVTVEDLSQRLSQVESDMKRILDVFLRGNVSQQRRRYKPKADGRGGQSRPR